MAFLLTLGMLFRTHSNLMDFIMTLAVPAEAQALPNNSRARSNSLFSLSSFTAANHISSLLGLDWKA